MTIATIDEARLGFIDLVHFPVPRPRKAVEPQAKRAFLIWAAVFPRWIGSRIGVGCPIIEAVFSVGTIGYPFADRKRCLVKPLKLTNMEVLPLRVFLPVVMIADVEGEQAFQALKAVPTTL